MEILKDSRNRAIDGPQAPSGWIPVPLTALREITSNNIPNAAGNGGILASDTTPIFEYVNGDTDSALRLRWASSNSDAVAFNLPLPPDLDFSQPVYVKLHMAMGGTTDTPTVTCESFFGVGDTKITDTSSAVSGTTIAVYTITIAAADVESAMIKRFASFELTVGSHTTDTALLYAVAVEYSKI